MFHFCLCRSDAQEEMGRWPDLQYCKTDLIAAKGVVFCKFARSSSALRALEAVTENGMVRAAVARMECSHSD